MKRLSLQWRDQPFNSAGLLEKVLENVGEFKKSQVSCREGYKIVPKVKEEHRTCWNLPVHYTEEFAAKITEFLRDQSNEISASLGKRCASWQSISASGVIAYGNGAFFKPHRDTNHSFFESRVLTFVYIFFRNPKRFSGGDLLLYDREGNPTERVTPSDGTLVVFDSDTLHEVTTICMENSDLQDGRFAFVGWGVVKHSWVRIAFLYCRAVFFEHRKTSGIKFLYNNYCKWLRPHLPHVQHKPKASKTDLDKRNLS